MRRYQTYTEIPMWVADFVTEAEKVDSVYQLSLSYIEQLQDEYEAFTQEMVI